MLKKQRKVKREMVRKATVRKEARKAKNLKKMMMKINLISQMTNFSKKKAMIKRKSKKKKINLHQLSFKENLALDQQL